MTVATKPLPQPGHAPVDQALVLRQRNLWSDALRRFSRNRLSMIAAFFVLLLIGMALFANVLAPEGYDHQVYDQAWQYPSWEHLLGTDPYGRELLTRIIYGARVSLAIGFIANFIALLIGLPAMAGVALGVAVKDRLSSRSLSYGFAALLVVVAVRMLLP